MKRFTTVLAYTLAAIVLAAVVWAIFALAGWLRSVNPTVAGAFVTGLVGFAGLAYVQWQSKTRDIAESHRASKLEVYSTFFDIAELFQDGSESPLTESGELPPELRKRFLRLNRGLIIWASPNVIKAWQRFKRASEAGANVLFAADDVYQAIRKDLGNSNLGLSRGDLIKLQLKDPDELKAE